MDFETNNDCPWKDVPDMWEMSSLISFTSCAARPLKSKFSLKLGNPYILMAGYAFKSDEEDISQDMPEMYEITLVEGSASGAVVSALAAATGVLLATLFF